MEERRLDVAGVPVRWLEAGEGPAVVLVHGIPTSPRLWRHVVARVRGARCLALELVGFGESAAAGAARDISVRAQAGYLGGWLDALGIERAVLVGHDLGGGVVQIAAVERPERCAGLVLANSIAYDNWPVAPVKAARAVGALVERLPPPAVWAALAAFILWGHDDPRRAREAVSEHRRGYLRPDGARAFARQVRSLHAADTLAAAPRLPSLRLPAELVWGAADRALRLDDGRRLARDLDARLNVVERGRHFVPEDHPDEVAAAVLRVLAASSGGGAPAA